MSKHVDDLVRHHESVARVFAEVSRRYPLAAHRQVDGEDLFVCEGGVRHDHITVVGDNLVPCEKVEVDDVWAPVVGSERTRRQTELAMDFLKEHHQDAYIGLIAWLVRK